MIEPNKYNENQLKMIALARVLCSRARVYLLDNPFTGLTVDCQKRVEGLLVEKQRNGTIIVMAVKNTSSALPDDWVVVLNQGVTK